MRRYMLGTVAALLALAPAAAASSLPRVSSGQRPGPPMLYERPPTAPQLQVRSPFRASPLLVSGTDAYRDGEYVYQDYLFDDHGANTVGGEGNTAKPGPSLFSPSAGDVAYPTASRFAANAADLVEFRIKPTANAIVYRVTLNTVKDSDTAVVGIGIDRDRSGGGAVPWPGNAGITSPGLERFITAWGTGGRVTKLPGGASDALPDGAVSIDRRTNQMVIRVPRSVMNPRSSTWRYVAGVGLREGSGFRQVPASRDATEDTPASGDQAEDAPGVFNLAFRFDEPQIKQPSPPTYDTFPGGGNWFEEDQARALKAGTSGRFHADVDFGALSNGADRRLHRPPGNEQARIMSSSLNLPEGVREGFPEFGGRLQPYLLTIPPEYPDRPAGLTFALHSLDGTYTQYAVFSPNQLRQLGDQRGDFVVTPLGRGPDGWYTDEGEADFFEVWGDVARRFELDPNRVALSGYSMGGYGTYKLGVEYPDLFGRAFTVVGPPGNGIWVPPAPPTDGEDTNTYNLLENVRWVPYLNWVAQQDELVPYAGPREQQTGDALDHGFDSLGLRSTLETFQGDHFTLAILDEWGAAREFLGNSRVKKRPSRVNYAFMPDADRRRLGLVHDHAYWVSRLRARDRSGDPDTDPARGEIDARSLAAGRGDPVTEEVIGAGLPTQGRPSPSTIQGTAWDSVPTVDRKNELHLTLENVSNALIDGLGARLEGDERLRVRITSDGTGRVRLALRFPGGTTVERVDGGPVPGAGGQGNAPEVRLGRKNAIFRVAAGTREYLFVPPN